MDKNHWYKHWIVDPNIFRTSTNGSSQLFKALLEAANVAKMGYRWFIGDGKNIKFWEDN